MFTVTVTNLSSGAQPVTINYDVPQFTTSRGYPAGTALSYYMGTAAAGATLVVSLDFTVLSGSLAPPDGSLITLVVSDQAHGALVSRSVAVNYTLAMLERPASPRGKLADPFTESPASLVGFSIRSAPTAQTSWR